VSQCVKIWYFQQKIRKIFWRGTQPPPHTLLSVGRGIPLPRTHHSRRRRHLDPSHSKILGTPLSVTSHGEVLGLPVSRKTPGRRLQEVDRPPRPMNIVEPSDDARLAHLQWPGRSLSSTDKLRRSGVRYARSAVRTTKPSCRQTITRDPTSRRRPSGRTLREGTGDRASRTSSSGAGQG